MIKKFFQGTNGKNVVVGLQHLFVMFGATVLVPLLTGLDISVALFTAGVGTIIFHIATKFKVPVYLGSSFAFIPAIIAISKMDGGSLPMALGGIVIAGLFYVIVAILIRYAVPVSFFHKLFPAHVTGPIIILIGLMLAPVAISNANQNWLIAGFTFLAAAGYKAFFERKGYKFLSMLPVLAGIILGYIFAAILGKVDFTPIHKAAIIGLPKFTLPVFNWRAISIAAPVAIVTMIEHFGDVLAIGNVVGKDFFEDPGIHRTLIGDGIATSFAALIGGPANTTYSENTGAVAITKNYNPVVMRWAAIFAIILAFVPKLSAVISTIPAPVIGGISILLFGTIASVGIKNMIDAKVDILDPNKLFVVVAMLVLGVGGAKLTIGSFEFSGLGLAAVSGIILNLILNWKTFKKTAS